MDSSADIDGIDVPKSVERTHRKRRSPNERYDIAVDLAKNVFEIAISREAGKVSKQLRVSRPKLVSFFAKQSAATVLLEACGSAHFWARTLRRLGHDVVLDLVRPYRRGSKNDRADTKALLEAYRNEEILSVPIKSVRQHTLAALHRLRSGWLSTRTARINAVRGILRELGLFIPKGAHFVVPAISELVEDADSDLPDVLRPHLRDACSEIRELKDKCAGIEHELKALAKQLPEVQRLLTIPGIGLLTATAIVGFVGDLRRFPSGRRFAAEAYLDLAEERREQRQQEPARQAPRLGALLPSRTGRHPAGGVRGRLSGVSVLPPSSVATPCLNANVSWPACVGERH